MLIHFDKSLEGKTFYFNRKEKLKHIRNFEFVEHVHFLLLNLEKEKVVLLGTPEFLTDKRSGHVSPLPLKLNLDIL